MLKNPLHSPAPWRRESSKIEPGPGRFKEQRTVRLMCGDAGLFPPILLISYCSSEADVRRFAANMHLIGAAPDMLTVLRACERRLESDGLIGHIRSVISKATGGES